MFTNINSCFVFYAFKYFHLTSSGLRVSQNLFHIFYILVLIICLNFLWSWHSYCNTTRKSNSVFASSVFAIFNIKQGFQWKHHSVINWGSNTKWHMFNDNASSRSNIRIKKPSEYYLLLVKVIKLQWSFLRFSCSFFQIEIFIFIEPQPKDPTMLHSNFYS